MLFHTVAFLPIVSGTLIIVALAVLARDQLITRALLALAHTAHALTTSGADLTLVKSAIEVSLMFIILCYIILNIYSKAYCLHFASSCDVVAS